MKCRDCPTDIRWLQHHKTGKPAPIESTPAPNGNVRIQPGSIYAVLSGEALEAAQEAGEDLHLNHFATCPGAAKRRRS